MADPDTSPPKPDPVCPVCSLPIRPGESVRFEHGEALHIICSVKKKRSTDTGTH